MDKITRSLVRHLLAWIRFAIIVITVAWMVRAELRLQDLERTVGSVPTISTHTIPTHTEGPAMGLISSPTYRVGD